MLPELPDNTEPGVEADGVESFTDMLADVDKVENTLAWVVAAAVDEVTADAEQRYEQALAMPDWARREPPEFQQWAQDMVAAGKATWSELVPRKMCDRCHWPLDGPDHQRACSRSAKPEPWSTVEAATT